MKKLVVVASIVIVIGLMAFGYRASFLYEAPKVGPPILTAEGSHLPCFVFMPVRNIGRPVSNLGPGTLQVAMSIWGSPPDVIGGSLEGRTTFNADRETRGSGPVLVRIGSTYFVPPSREYDPKLSNLFIGEIASRRKYPVHVGCVWRRDNLQGKADFVIQPDKDVATAVSMPKS